MGKGILKKNLLFMIYALFIALSFFLKFEPGMSIGKNFWEFSQLLFKILPAVFILIGLFQVWVNKETVEKHLGKGSGAKGYFWAVLLSGTTVGGMYVGLPVAYALYSKGARISVIFTFIGACALCRIPMTLFEATFLGVKFTVIRLSISIPLVIISSILLERYLQNKDFAISK